MNSEALNKRPTQTIMLVEDSRDIQLLLASLLKSAGYEVICASNGLEALDMLRSSDTLPALIILDIMMPEMDGFEFRKEQEKDVRFASIPIVAMTAYGDVQSKAMQIGAQGYLKKPFSDVDTILQTVAKFASK